MKGHEFLGTLRVILALLLCAAMVMPLFGCAKEDPEDTQGTTEATRPALTGEEAAVRVVEAVGGDVYANALSELTEKSTNTVDGDSYIRLQQNYHGIPVYGRTVVYGQDENGALLSVSGNVADVDESISLTPTVTQEQAEASIRAYLTDELGVENPEEIHIDPLRSEDLCIYNMAEDGTSRLAHCVLAANRELVVDAHSGEVLTVTEMVQAATGYTASDVNRQDGFDVRLLDGKYILEDLDRKFSVYNLAGKSSEKLDNLQNSKQVASTDEIFGNDKGEETYEDAVRLYRNIASLTDYFQKVCPFDYTEIFVWYGDGFDRGFNARGGRYGDDENGLYFGQICMGTQTGVDDIDVTAHEYTHVISRKLVGWAGNNLETSAINEGISDIYGELAEASVVSSAPDWSMRTDHHNKVNRNIADPNDTQTAAHIEDDILFATKDAYYYSTVLSHAAYLMWNGIDGDNSKKVSADDLAKLWYRAMLMMPSDCDFAECRKLVELAARSMNCFSDEQLAAIGQAFDTVGIESSDSVTVDYLLERGGTLSVYDVDGSLYAGYTLQISGESGGWASEKFALPYNSTQIVEAAEPLALNLPDGNYLFAITDKHSADIYAFTVSVVRDIEDAESNIDLYTSYQVPLVVEMPLVSDAFYDTVSNHCYHIPRINLAGDLAAGVNEEIYHQLYSGTLRDGAYGESEEPYTVSMAYSWAAKDELVSVLVAFDYVWSYTDYCAYNVSTRTGERVDDQVVLDAFGLSQEAFAEKVRAALEAKFTDLYGEAYTRNESNATVLEAYDRQLQNTLADENVASVVPYVDANGDLCVIAKVYSLAGASSYLRLVNITGTATPVEPRCDGDHTGKQPATENTSSGGTDLKPYVDVLLDIHSNPGAYYEMFSSDPAEVEENMFAVGDIDGDGQDELLIDFTYTFTAAMFTRVWKIDEGTQTAYVYDTMSSGSQFYTNGVVKADAYHNQGSSDSIWPYSLYRYEEDAQRYEMFASVYCVDEAYDTFGEYVASDDTDGDGVIYYFEIFGEEKKPLTREAYEAYVAQYCPEDARIQFQWQNLTLDNIRSLAD